MNINNIRSDEIYKKMLNAPKSKKDDIYRYEMMKPFEKKWDCYNVPLKAKQENGYDVVMASSMLGYLAPGKVDESQEESIHLLSNNSFWESCQTSIEDAFSIFERAGVELPVQDYLYTILLAEPSSPYH